MQKADLEHIIRAAADVTNEYEIIIVGSQSILGSIAHPPEVCTMSAEADVLPMNDEKRLSDLVDGNLGEGSLFHETYGYYAQGVDSSTSKLPIGWRERLVRVQNQNTNGKVGLCLDPLDLFLAKCVANREKDRNFNRALLASGIVKFDEAVQRASLLPVSKDAQERVVALIHRLAAEAGVKAP